MSRALMIVLLLPIGCGQPADLEGPAPAGALECALAHALAAGYQLVDGGADEGYVRLIQRIAPEPVAGRPVRSEPGLGDVAVVEPAETLPENELLIRDDGGRLLISIMGVAEAETGDLEGSTAEEQGRTILAMCTSSPPVPPESDDAPTTPPAPAAPL